MLLRTPVGVFELAVLVTAFGLLSPTEARAQGDCTYCSYCVLGGPAHDASASPSGDVVISHQCIPSIECGHPPCETRETLNTKYQEVSDLIDRMVVGDNGALFALLLNHNDVVSVNLARSAVQVESACRTNRDLSAHIPLTPRQLAEARDFAVKMRLTVLSE